MTFEGIVALAVIVLFVALAFSQRGSNRLAFNVEFEAAVLDTPAGRLSGKDLKVIHYAFQELRGGNEGGARSAHWVVVLHCTRFAPVNGDWTGRSRRYGQCGNQMGGQGTDGSPDAGRAFAASRGQLIAAAVMSASGPKLMFRGSDFWLVEGT